MNARYEVRKGLSGKTHFVLIAPNNEIIGKSKSVKTQEDILPIIEVTRVCSQDLANYERKNQRTGKHLPYFNLCNADRTEALITSEAYNSPAGREKGIDAWIKYGPTTEIVYV